MSGAPAAARFGHSGPACGVGASPRSGPRQGRAMLRREKGAQVAKNIIAERERVIELGEHASFSPWPAAGRAFRDGLGREARKVVLDRGNLRVEIGDLAWRRERQLVE